MEELTFNKEPHFEPIRLKEGIARIRKLELPAPAVVEETSVTIDFDEGPLAVKGAKYARCKDSYIISPILQENLSSVKHINCTAVLGMGRNKVTRAVIAFISHQNPAYFVHGDNDEKKQFVSDLKDTLAELDDLSEVGSVEVVLLGGNYDLTNPEAQKSIDYFKSIQILAKVVRETLGAEPMVIATPNFAAGGTDIAVETQTRSIWVDRGTKQTELNGYLVRDFEQAMKTWGAAGDESDDK